VYFTSVFLGGNPDLGPETSDNLSVGFDWTPRSGRLKGLNLSLTYGKIDFSNRVASTQIEFILDQTTLFAMGIPIVRDPGTNLITSLRLIPVNSSTRTSESIDLSASYDMEFGRSFLTLGITATEILKLEDQLTAISPIREIVGLQTGPAKLVWRSWVTWAMPTYAVNLYANHSSAYINTGTDAVAVSDPVDSYLTFDLTGTVRLDARGWQFNAGVRNLFDADFPFFNGFNRPWDPRRVDTHGRTAYLEISKEFSLFR
jgi:outer membrane receptor protein involved in Fe transport